MLQVIFLSRGSGATERTTASRNSIAHTRFIPNLGLKQQFASSTYNLCLFTLRPWAAEQ